MNVSEPRTHHYVFAHQLLPQMFFQGPDDLVRRVRLPDGARQIKAMWEDLGNRLMASGEDELSSEGLSVAPVEMHSRQGAIVTMSPPRTPPEAYFAAILAPAPGEDDARYFVLELADPGESGYAPGDGELGVLCEWLKEPPPPPPPPPDPPPPPPYLYQPDTYRPSYYQPHNDSPGAPPNYDHSDPPLEDDTYLPIAHSNHGRLIKPDVEAFARAIEEKLGEEEALHQSIVTALTDSAYQPYSSSELPTGDESLANTSTQQAEAVRTETIALLKDLAEKAAEFELSQPPDAFQDYSRRLQENTYKVLVVGEAKRGKSSFVNALIGRDILPTDVRVATSQVFDVRPVGREAYHLRFEDDSVRDIDLEDLPRYGSQVLEDAGERPRLDQIIRWIEVDEPHIRFLPEGVSLLDTPGLGALYAAHAQITQRFVPQADAVIFVLDSEKAIVQSELDFIEKILDVTSDIFFIQTKIDLYDVQAWQEIRRRNREILEERFGNRLTDTSVWPISNTLLLSAAAGGDDAEEDLEDSGHKEMEVALQTFLFRVAGWSRSAAAVLLAGDYHATSRQVLVGRLATLEENSEQSRSDSQQLAADRVRQFEIDWGPQGQRRQELVENIQHIIAEGRESIREAVQPGGRIYAAESARIEALSTPEEAELQVDSMPGDVSARAVDEWRRVLESTRERCIDELGPFLESAERLNIRLYAEPERPVAPRTSLGEVQGRLRQRLGGSYKIWLPVGAVAGAILAYTMGPTVARAAAKAAAGIFGVAVRGYRSLDERQRGAAKDKLQDILDLTLQRVRGQLLEGNAVPGHSGLGVVDEEFAVLERTMLSEVQTIAQKKEEEARAEYARLVEAGRLDEQQRQASIERTRPQLAEWDAIGTTIDDLGAKLNALDQTLAGTPPTPG